MYVIELQYGTLFLWSCNICHLTPTLENINERFTIHNAHKYMFLFCFISIINIWDGAYYTILILKFISCALHTYNQIFSFIFINWSKIYHQIFKRVNFVYTCAAVEDLELSRWEECDAINRFNPATLLCLSQTRSWTSNVKGRWCLFFVFSEFSEDGSWFFVLLILLTIIKLSFHKYYIHTASVLFLERKS